jgi:geranylgeranyl diphosphate synthase type I
MGGRPTATGESSARKVLARSRSLIEPALRTAVDGLPHRMRHVAGHHLGWWDENGDPTRAGGKSIRPALALLSAAAVGGNVDEAVPAAVAVELVHNFSLLHDDVMDGDATRRHRPTAWKLFGVNTAVLAGDALLGLAPSVLAASGHATALSAIQTLSATVQELIQGQSLDLDFEHRTDVGLAECQVMARAKTAALLGCACCLGASFGGGTSEQVRYLRSFGERLGLAFQHVDDLLGIWGDPVSTGKSVYTDLNDRKKTLPVVAALESDTPAAIELAALYVDDRPLSSSELGRAAELVEQAGGRAFSTAQANQLLTQALADLDAARPAADARAELVKVAELMTHRDH